MIRTQVYIPDDLYSQALVVAQIRGVSVSVVLRDGLAKEVGRVKKSRRGGLSLIWRGH